MTIDPEDAPVPDRMARAETDFVEAADAYHALRQEIGALISEVRDGKTARAARLKTVAADLARAIGVLVREKERLDAARSGERSCGKTGDLDLQFARDEICSRLARLRTDRDGLDLS
jgi:hypothetical protein